MRQARLDASFIMQGLQDAWLKSANLLEIGCGNGRLVSSLAHRVRSYTGVDISARFVAEAKARHAGVNLRFIETDGATLPVAAKDRRYGLIFSAAVFIHCPLEVIAAMTDEALRLLAEDGVMRIQVLADPHDGEGIVAGAPDAATLKDMEQPVLEMMHEQAASSEAELASEAHHYRGHVFTYAAAEEFARARARNELEYSLLRIDPLFIYFEFRKSPPSGT